MSKALRLFLIAIVGCILQTNAAQIIRIADVSPDLMIAMLVALTSFCGLSGCFCTGALMIMFYDASVGYVQALNLIGYVLISLAAPAARFAVNEKLRKWKHKSVLVMMVICFVLTLSREILYMGYLFLIGAEFGATAIVRLLLSTAYTTLLVVPCQALIRFMLNWHLPEGFQRFFASFRTGIEPERKKKKRHAKKKTQNRENVH